MRLNIRWYSSLLGYKLLREKEEMLVTIIFLFSCTFFFKRIMYEVVKTPELSGKRSSKMLAEINTLPKDKSLD